jgi:hypothetical protein
MSRHTSDRLVAFALTWGLASAALVGAAYAQPQKPSGGFSLQGIPFVRIPRGNFVMGSEAGEPGRNYKEAPQRISLFRDFGLSAREITMAQYYAVTEPLRSIPPKQQNKPVTEVSWDDALKFCEKLSQATGRKCRLPEEDEWEYACRARPGTTAGAMFAIWKGDLNRDLEQFKKGNPSAIEQHAAKTFNYNSDGPVEVGRYSPNAFGLYDMHGNVWEWCGDPGKGRPTDPRGRLDFAELGRLSQCQTRLGAQGNQEGLDRLPCPRRALTNRYGMPTLATGLHRARLAIATADAPVADEATAVTRLVLDGNNLDNLRLPLVPRRGLKVIVDGGP